MENSFYKSGDMPSKKEILSRIDLNWDDPHKIVVTPLINLEKQIEDGTIDLRLSNEFIVAKRSKFTTLDPLGEQDNIDSKILEYQEKVYVKLGDKFILHPQQFVLGGTLEYIKMPVDMIGYVLGRSSWGRLGLLIATATVVHTGYIGIITLELTNLGDTPITLYPGTRIAQLALHKINIEDEEKDTKLSEFLTRKTKYKAAVSPIFSKIHQDSEWSIIKELNDSFGN